MDSFVRFFMFMFVARYDVIVYACIYMSYFDMFVCSSYVCVYLCVHAAARSSVYACVNFVCLNSCVCVLASFCGCLKLFVRMRVFLCVVVRLCVFAVSRVRFGVFERVGAL